MGYEAVEPSELVVELGSGRRIAVGKIKTAHDQIADGDKRGIASSSYLFAFKLYSGHRLDEFDDDFSKYVMLDGLCAPMGTGGAGGGTGA